MKKALIISFFAMLPLMCAAQGDNIYEVLGVTPKTAIVRYWHESEYVVYYLDGAYYHFSLVDMSANTFVDFESKNIIVNDFEIERDTVFFCGTKVGDPVFGFFHIPTLFAAATGMQTMNLGGWHPSPGYPSGQERITDLMKLKVQKCIDGIHGYMTGKAELYFHDSTYNNRCIVDMRYSWMGGGWTGDYVQEYGSIYYYDDITVTADSVVVIGHKNASCGHYGSSYPKPAFAFLSLIPYSPYPETYYYSGGGGGYNIDPNKPLMIEHLFGEYYAIVGYAYISVSYPLEDWGTAISIYNGSANCVYRCYIPQGANDTARWKLLDFRYNPNMQKLYLLQEMSNPVSSTVNSVMCEFDVNTTGIITSATASFEPEIKYFSLDQCFGTWETVAVGKKKLLRLWHHNNGDDCVQKETLPLIPLPLDNASMGYFQSPVNLKPQTVQETGYLTAREIIKDCGE